MFKVFTVLCSVMLAFACVSFTAEARQFTYTVGDHEYMDMPIYHLDQYPATPEGYASFLYDTVSVVNYNYSEYNNYHDIADGWNDVMYYFYGDDAAQVNVPDPRQVCSNYYYGGGSTSGASHTEYTDGHGGNFALDGSGTNYMKLYYTNAVGEREILWSFEDCSGNNLIGDFTVVPDADPLYALVNVYGGYADDPSALDNKYTTIRTYLGGNTNENVGAVPVSSPVGGSVGSRSGHLLRDPDGNLYFVDDDGNTHPFQPDGTIIMPDGKPYYFTPDAKDLTYDSQRELGDDLALWALLMLNSLRNMSDDDNGGHGGCNCSPYLAYIAQKCHDIDLKTSDMLDVLKDIEANTRKDDNVLDNTVDDLVMPEDDALQVDMLSDAIAEKLGFASYFKTLNTFLSVIMGSDYSNDTNFENFFDIGKYIKLTNVTPTTSGTTTTTTTATASVNGSSTPKNKPSRTLRAETQKADAFQSLIFSKGVYNQPSPPAIYIELFGERYNMFGWISSDMYNYIFIFKTLLRVVLYITWLFWVVKWLPNIIRNVGTVTKE